MSSSGRDYLERRNIFSGSQVKLASLLEVYKVSYFSLIHLKKVHSKYDSAFIRCRLEQESRVWSVAVCNVDNMV